MNIRRTLATVLLTAGAVVILAGCNTSKPAPPANPGDPKVYAAIDMSTSCTQIQGWFDLYVDQAKTYLYNGDQVHADNARAYEKAALARLGALHCYG
jgi:hypothetical protein